MWHYITGSMQNVTFTVLVLVETDYLWTMKTSSFNNTVQVVNAVVQAPNNLT